jgi:hypothetical protein
VPTRPNTELKPRRIRKAWHKGLASLPLVDGRRRRYDGYPLKDIPVGRNTGFDLNDDQLSELARVLRDLQLARRVLQIQRERHPYGTMPELVILEFLERKNVDFTYQAQLNGGYRAGGLVPDFVIDKNGTGHVLAIQGIYWHNVPGKREKDQTDKLRLLTEYHNGKPITLVTFVWENRIMQGNPARERVLEDALTGIEHAA